jgi:hypothetical protein
MITETYNDWLFVILRYEGSVDSIIKNVRKQ